MTPAHLVFAFAKSRSAGRVDALIEQLTCPTFMEANNILGLTHKPLGCRLWEQDGCGHDVAAFRT
jgi:hypothetical protein